MVYRPDSPTGCGEIPNRPDPVIEINIKSNRFHIGKTTIAGVIFNALQKAGFINTNVICQDGDFDAVMREAMDEHGNVISDSAKQTKIYIKDVNELIDKPPNSL